MHVDTLTAAEQRVLGCLIEKRFTTPDQYPLTLNSLRLACNQATNRDPVVNYDETTVREAAQRLTKYGLARLASGHSSRAVKYRHLAEDALGISGGELALLAILLLRGDQTPGELKLRSERMASFDSLESVDTALAALCERGYTQRIERRPGQKEDRFRQVLGEPTGATSEPGDAGREPTLVNTARVAVPSDANSAGSPPSPTTDQRLAALEAKVERLAEALAGLIGE